MSLTTNSYKSRNVFDGLKSTRHLMLTLCLGADNDFMRSRPTTCKQSNYRHYIKLFNGKF